MLELEPLEKLCKLKLALEIMKSANKILGQHVHGEDTILEITDIIYTMDKAREVKMGIILKYKTNVTRKIKSTGNRCFSHL